MARQSARVLRRRTIRRRAATAAVALIASAAAVAPAVAAADSPTIVVAGDSVLVTSLPIFGATTIQATRPDALTGKPVVIGQYSSTGNPYTPFSVNTTAPGPANPSGDCWQKGALTQALTPDLQPGDTVTVTQSALFGASPSATSVTVGPSPPGTILGPLAGCDKIAPWARNAITSGPSAVAGGPITVSGIAQPLATAVAVAANDGTRTSDAESVTPAADGHWSATIPAAHLARLANAPLNVTPVFAVPDVSTGAPAHIAGVGASVRKSGPAGGGQPPSPTGGRGPTGGQGPGGRKPRVTALRSASSVPLAAVRIHGVTASFRVPAGAKTVEVRLLRGSKPLYVKTLRAGKAGSRQTVHLGNSRLYRRLRRGHYTIAVRAGTSRSTLGPATRHRLTIR